MQPDATPPDDDRPGDGIPDVWPPDPAPSLGGDDSGAVRELPIFPLRGVFLLPRQVMPLHVFEPRYRQLVEDVLDSQGRFAIATVLEGEDIGPGMEETPPKVLPIAGVGEIARHERTEDGRYFLWLFGIGRHAIEEVDSDRPYRRVKAAPLALVPPTEREVTALEPRIRAALAERSQGPRGEAPEVPEGIPLEFLVDALSQKLHLPQAAMEPIFCEPDIARRAQLVLDAHVAFPAPEVPDEDADADDA